MLAKFKKEISASLVLIETDPNGAVSISILQFGKKNYQRVIYFPNNLYLCPLTYNNR